MAVPLVAATLAVAGGAALAASGGASGSGTGPFSPTFWSAVAAKVGVPASTLEGAVKSVLQQERASGQFKGPRGWRRGPAGGPGMGMRGALGGPARSLLTTAATYLGLTRSQLLSDLRSGKSLAAIATAQGKSVSGLEAALTSQASSAISQLVNRTWTPPAKPGTGSSSGSTTTG
jgi:hypothetical protein